MKWTKLSILLFSSALCLQPETTFAQKVYFLQAGSYLARHTAEANLNRLQQKLGLMGRIHSQLINDKQYYQVWLGPYTQFKEINHSKTVVKNFGQEAFIRAYEVSSAPSILKPTVKQVVKSIVRPTAKQAVKTIAKPTAKHPVKSIAKRNYNRAPIAQTSILPASPPKSNPPLTSNLMTTPSHRGRSILEGTLATKTDFVNGDLLEPILPLSDGMAYVDGAGKYGGDTAWFLSAGTGFRNIFDSRYLVGAYLFADYNQSRRSQAFWVINPGLEYMNERWDGTINGYFPTSSQKSLGLSPGAALGIDSIHFQNHSILENFYNVLDVTGAGADGEIGYTWNNFYNIRTSIGGYYFNPKVISDFAGVEGGIEFPVADRFTVSIHDAYDHVQGNTFMGTLRFTLDFNPPTDSLRQRLFDPFRRHLGAQQTGAGIPIISTNQFVKETALETNAWFFAPGGAAFGSVSGFANCTYEHPCGEFSQAAISGINSLAPNARLLLETGTYENPLVGSGLTLASGQQVNGRMNYFKRAATGSFRPLINDSLLLPGVNALSNLQIKGNTVRGGNLEGVEVLSGAMGSIDINNSLISSTVNGQAYNAVGLRSYTNEALVTLNNSAIVSTVIDSAAQQATGLDASTAGQITLTTSSINSSSSSSGGVNGIRVNATPLVISSGRITATSNGGDTFAVNAISSNMNLLNSSLITTAEDNLVTTSNAGVISNNGSLLNINTSSLSLNANNFGTGALYGINIGNGGVANLNQSTITLNATNSANYVAGVNMGASSQPTSLNMVNGVINLNLDHTGFTAFNYAINGGGNSVNLDGPDILVIGRNMGQVQGIYTAGSLVYQNTRLLSAVNTGGTASTVGGPGTITNLGSVFCVVIVGGNPQMGYCP